MAQYLMTSSQKALLLELKSLQEEAVEGAASHWWMNPTSTTGRLPSSDPPNTLYEGGYFRLILNSLLITRIHHLP
eukprot:bmy_00264T0